MTFWRKKCPKSGLLINGNTLITTLLRFHLIYNVFFAGRFHLSHGHISHGGSLRLSHSEGRTLGYFQRQQSSALGTSTKRTRIPLPLSSNLKTKKVVRRFPENINPVKKCKIIYFLKFGLFDVFYFCPANKPTEKNKV